MYKMLTTWFAFTVSCAVWVNGQNADGNALNDSSLSSGKSGSETRLTGYESKISPYEWDPQVHGFNRTKVSSGPIVIIDNKTLFITNLKYNGAEASLKFWAGTDGPNRFVADADIIANNTNVYVNFPEDLGVDSIEYLGIGPTAAGIFDYVTFYELERGSVKPHNDSPSSLDEKPIYRIPKCCDHSQVLSDSECVQWLQPITFNITIYYSNATGLDPDLKLDPSQYQLRPYVDNLSNCFQPDRFILYYLDDEKDEYGLIYNSSLIIKGESIKHHGQFCIDQNTEGQTRVVVCDELAPIEEVSPNPNIYLPVLIASIICFGACAAIYFLILKVRDIHKRCLIFYSTSMCVTFLALVLIQVQSNMVACYLFGSVFLFSTVLSFIWLSLLCLDLLYIVKVCIENNRNDQRFRWYVGFSLGISTLVLMISLLSGELGIPDVPPSFLKSYGQHKCSFETTTSRIFIFFVPMGLSIVASIVPLVLLNHYFQVNDAKYRNIFDWLENKYHYKFMSRAYIIIIIISCFWVVNAAYNFFTMNGMTQLALDVIEASLGIVNLSCFLNKYTVREIKEKLFKKTKKITEESLDLNGFRTPVTPRTPASEDSEPMFPINLVNNNANR
ncbi:G-protein coupled receptor Mth-like [Cylas formicarius]|uniref:G-protein coupled receptor Mth-like n=1 Tax=Cylas formicarius TaxID=197179 RepID=UPI002958B2EE|nr:G-protein coupled receptor Mth-like [Cylas formicarius]